MKLNIGSGIDYRHDYINIDWNRELKADIYLDIDKKNLPQKDSTVESIDAFHVIEHLNNFNHFMNECRRVLISGGSLHIRTPSPLCEWFWQDPSHIRGYMPNTFIIYCVAKEWKIKGLDLWSKANVNIEHSIENNVQAVIIDVVMTK